MTNPAMASLRPKAVTTTLTRIIASRVSHLLCHFTVVEYRLLTLVVLALSHHYETLVQLATLSQTEERSMCHHRRLN